MTDHCPTCNHPRHEPACCEQCNCGESSLAHLTGFRKLKICAPQSFSSTSSLTRYGYDMGHRVPPRRTDQH